MQVNKVRLLPVSSLIPNPDNPKEKIGKAYLAGLRATIEQYGFCGVLNIAKNLDKTYTVLDGNTRLGELKDAKVEKVSCCEVPACAEGSPAWREERKKFALAFDRNRKKFDEEAVLDQLKQLAAAGQDVKALAKLTTKANLDRLLAESNGKVGGDTATPIKVAPMASLVLYGPAETLKDIGELLKTVRGRLSMLERAQAVLTQADWTDDEMVTLLLATVATFAKGAT